MGDFKSEFQRSNFGLYHEPIDDFFRSQWQRKRVSVLWLIYRWLLALCFTAGAIVSLVMKFKAGTWFIYLTHWGLILYMLTSIIGATLVSIYACNGDKFASGSSMVQFYWCLYFTTLSTALLISCIYWSFIYPVDPSARADDLLNLWVHCFNSVLMILDHMLVAFPTRLLHFIYPLMLGIIFSVFTLIYYLAGGRNAKGKTYIYKILDWSKPGWTILAVLGCCILLIIFVLIIFGLFKLRMAIFQKQNNSKMVLD